MNLLMTATPLAMDFCALPYAQAATVIRGTSSAMYAPGFVTGSLIKRFGVLRIILAGVVVMAAGAVVALHGRDRRALRRRRSCWSASAGTSCTPAARRLLTEAYTPAEKARTQGANDFIVFSIMGVSSFSSGALVSAAGWKTMNVGALPILAGIGLAVLWYARRRRPRTD